MPKCTTPRSRRSSTAPASSKPEDDSSRRRIPTFTPDNPWVDAKTQSRGFDPHRPCQPFLKRKEFLHPLAASTSYVPHALASGCKSGGNCSPRRERAKCSRCRYVRSTPGGVARHGGRRGRRVHSRQAMAPWFLKVPQKGRFRDSGVCQRHSS
jgi:hypothetical protein